MIYVFATRVLLRQVPTALPMLQRLTLLDYAHGGGWQGGPPGWERELLVSTAALTGLRSLSLAAMLSYKGTLS